MTWGFLWLMFALKIPIFMLLGLVWWAIKAEPDPEVDPSEDGGQPLHPRPHPSRPRRPFPRRGPHGGTDVLAPAPRVRTAEARARALDPEH